jgi:FkbM family methyltransferase
VKYIDKQKSRFKAYRARKKFLAVEIAEDDVVIDCGANVGDVTRYFCNKGATVYSFEPNPYAFQVLIDKFGESKNVHCIEKGVASESGRRQLYLHENSDSDQVHWSTGSSFLSFKKNVRKDNFIEVATIDLCDFIQKLKSRVRILKMDVEGAECEVLKKLIDTEVVNLIDHIFVETHDNKIPELRKDTEHLKQLIRRKDLRSINLDWI